MGPQRRQRRIGQRFDRQTGIVSRSSVIAVHRVVGPRPTLQSWTQRRAKLGHDLQPFARPTADHCHDPLAACGFRVCQQSAELLAQPDQAGCLEIEFDHLTAAPQPRAPRCAPVWWW